MNKITYQVKLRRVQWTVGTGHFRSAVVIQSRVDSVGSSVYIWPCFF